MANYKIIEQGEPNEYVIVDDNMNWLANIKFNGKLTIIKQRDHLNKIVKIFNKTKK